MKQTTTHTVDKLSSIWGQKFNSARGSNPDEKKVRVFMSLLKEYAGDPLVGFELIDGAKVYNAVMNWGKSLFTGNTLPPNATLVASFVRSYMHDDAEVWNISEFLNMTYFMALLKKSLTNIELSDDTYLRNIISVAASESGVNFSALNADVVISETNNRVETARRNAQAKFNFNTRASH